MEGLGTSGAQVPRKRRLQQRGPAPIQITADSVPTNPAPAGIIPLLSPVSIAGSQQQPPPAAQGVSGGVGTPQGSSSLADSFKAKCGFG